MKLMYNVYKGVFNFPHKAYILCRSAHSERQAKVVMGHALARMQEVDIGTVMKWMKENEDKYLIKLEIEWREEDEN